MIRHGLFLLAGLAACSAASASAAPATPRFLPDRDVAVTYTLNAPGRPPATYLFAFNAAEQRGRIDDPANGTFFIVDLSTGSASIVVPSLHSVIQAPDLSNITREISSADGATFTPLGSAAYAGLPCQDYAVQDRQGAARACLTADGVILHFDGRDAHGSAEVTATTVAYGHEPGQNFLPPDGYGRIALPPGALEALLKQQ